MNKKLVIALILLAIIAILVYNYLYQDHRDVTASEASASFTSVELIQLFTDDDASNDIQALDQIIEVTGLVTFVADNNVTLDGQIFIEVYDSSNIKEKEKVTIKGRCLGYDDLMQEVKLDQASLK